MRNTPEHLFLSLKYNHFVDGKEWRDGPWHDEPDIHEWTDEYSGYNCLIKRNPNVGFLTAYVYIQSDHPFYGIYYGDIAGQIDVHGGLSYSEMIDEEWCFGFDCNHYNDYTPGGLRSPHSPDFFSDLLGTGEYRNFRYVVEQTESLAKQLYEVNSELGRSQTA